MAAIPRRGRGPPFSSRNTVIRRPADLAAALVDGQVLRRGGGPVPPGETARPGARRRRPRGWQDSPGVTAPPLPATRPTR
ncbi:MAG: hypothetical protein M0C28_46605 [Candidatus Moduliflexus flocculans]|nr:hypothetical protein [Candidatus Moduliflexus flocculans]